MFCRRCGNPVDENFNFCTHCGTPLLKQSTPQTQQGVSQAQQNIPAQQDAPVFEPDASLSQQDTPSPQQETSVLQQEVPALQQETRVLEQDVIQAQQDTSALQRQGSAGSSAQTIRGFNVAGQTLVMDALPDNKFVQDVAEFKVDGQSGRDEQPRRKSKTKLILIIAGIVVTLAVVASVVAAFALGVFDTQAETPETEIPSASGETETEAVTSVQDPVALSDAEIGDVVEFGSYPQTSSSSPQAIRWIVLAVEDGRAFLLSEECLDAMAMYRSLPSSGDATWADSLIRDWLNDDFLDDAFSESEQNSIFKTRTGYDGSESLDDQVFLLSADDVDLYLESSWRVANATTYAQSRGASSFDDDGAANWWLRDSSTAGSSGSFLNVFYDGTIDDIGYPATKSDIAVRPALWVSIEGDAEGIVVYGASLNDLVEDAGDSQASSGVEGGTTVTLTVEAADGSTLSGEVRRDANGYVIADSSTREYTLEELRSLGLSDAEMCIAWNEPYAREGYVFYNSDLQAYFESCSWYTAKGRDVSLVEGGAATLNVARLQQLADESGEAARWRYLARE